MVGKLWEDFISSSMTHFRREWVIIPLYGLVGLLLLGGIAVSWFAAMKFHPYLPYSIPMTLLAVGGSIAAFVLYRFKLRGVVFILFIGVMAGMFFYTTRVVFPLVNPYKSARAISREITSRIQPGEKLAIYGDFVTAPYNFYTGIVPILEMEKKEELLRYLQSHERIFCLLKFRDFDQLQKTESSQNLRLIARRQVGDNDMVLISNKSY
jgi:hypothetical protein